jgi:hypothetical protein
MSTAPATAVSIAMLSIAGLLPTLALVGWRWMTLPLFPLVGAIVAALAATCFMAVGGSLLGWFLALAVVAALCVAAYWARRPDRRPWPWPWPGRSDPISTPTSTSISASAPWHWRAGAIGALVILLACLWCLRGLATPTVGFDARVLWIMRAGWLLQSHHQLLVNMRSPNLILVQTPYPPLVSASIAVGWQITGAHTVRLGVVLIAMLNTCALSVAAFAVVESGRTCTRRLRARENTTSDVNSSSGGRLTDGGLVFGPAVIGVVAAGLLVFVAFGVTEPFMTNGYADPIWSLAAVGAVAFGLQLETARVNQGVALILVLVAGMSKDEGFATAIVLILLLAGREIVGMSTVERRRQWWRPTIVAVAVLTAIGAWPGLMRILHVRAGNMTHAPVHAFPSRARTAFDGLTPYLHVIVLAAPVAIIGGLVLSQLRRRCGLANDWWAWLGLAGGLAAVIAGYVTGTVPLQDWLVGTADRVSEFSTLTAWWILAVWAVVASGAVGQRTRPTDPAEAEPAARPTLVSAE